MSFFSSPTPITIFIISIILDSKSFLGFELKLLRKNMPSKNDRYSSSSFSSSSSSSQLSTPRSFHNGPSQVISKYPLCDVEKAKCSFGLSMPKSNEELRGEIAELETEILQLERYLLSLYRSSFGDHLSALSLLDNSSRCLKTPPLTKFHNDRDSSVSDTSVLFSFKSLSKMDKIRRTESRNTSLADLLGLNTLNPNELSKEIVRLICLIYYKLSDNEHSRLVKNSKNEDICGHELGVVIHKLYLYDENLKSIESMLQNFRSLVQKLEKVDPTRMAREEKLAFWINIHNALVMHAYIVYGIVEDTRSTMIFKAAFNIGGEWLNAYDIQSSILRVRTYHLASGLRTLFSPARSSKTSTNGQTYALDYAEPLLYFALSTGAITDPMVRVYTPEGIFQELRQARDGFIQTSVGFEKETKILLPKLIYNYAKDTSLDMAELFDTISKCLKETQRTTMRRVVKKKKDGCIRWINHDSNFRYIIHSELMRRSLVTSAVPSH